jgi:hypothetical protein
VVDLGVAEHPHGQGGGLAIPISQNPLFFFFFFFFFLWLFGFGPTTPKLAGLGVAATPLGLGVVWPPLRGWFNHPCILYLFFLIFIFRINLYKKNEYFNGSKCTVLTQTNGS